MKIDKSSKSSSASNVSKLIARVNEDDKVTSKEAKRLEAVAKRDDLTKAERRKLNELIGRGGDQFEPAAFEPSRFKPSRFEPVRGAEPKKGGGEKDVAGAKYDPSLAKGLKRPTEAEARALLS